MNDVQPPNTHIIVVDRSPTATPTGKRQ